MTATEETTTTSLMDNFDVPIPSALPTGDEQEIELLRTLGRLEFMTVDQIRAGFFPGMTVKAVRDRLDEMVEAEIIWKTKGRFMNIAKTPKGRAFAATTTSSRKKEWLKHPFVYGLTDAGKQLLHTLEVEQDEATHARLRSRDPRAKKLPDVRTLGHDLQVSWWVFNVVLEATRNRLCRAIYAQVEFISEERQRIDALIILRFSLTRPRKEEDIGPIPWFDGTPRADDEIDIRLALEVDRGTEELAVLLGKGAAYRDLTFNGVYTQLLGGPVLPVFLVQTSKPHLTVKRVRQIATEYREVWPGGWGVISTPAVVSHRDAGALWGKYHTLATDVPFFLLTELRVASDGRVSFVPVCDLAVWLEHRVIPTATSTPEQVAGQAGGRARWSRATEEVAKGFSVLDEDTEGTEDEDAEGIEDVEDVDKAS